MDIFLSFNGDRIDRRAGMHHIPIVNAEQRLVGMVTQSDLIAARYAGGSRSEGAMPAVPSIT